MRHFQAEDQQRDPRGVERGLLRLADELRHHHAVLRDGEIEVEPVVGLDPRHHQRVTGIERVDREERHDEVVTPHERARELALDDAGEDGGHRQIE